MTIAESMKKYTPKTTKGWVLFGVGGTAAVLLGNYLYVDDKESAWAMRLWRKVSPLPAAPPAPPPSQAAARPPRHPHARRPPQMMPPPMYVQPMPQVMPSSAVYVEPSAVFESFPRYMHGYPHHYFPYGGYAHHERPFFHHHHVAGGGPSAAGAPPVDAPQAPEKTRTVVPPPGTYGIVGRSPNEAVGVSADQAPCGPGLWFDPATHSCVPMPPSTMPMVPTQAGYDWQ